MTRRYCRVTNRLTGSHGFADSYEELMRGKLYRGFYPGWDTSGQVGVVFERHHQLLETVPGVYDGAYKLRRIRDGKTFWMDNVGITLIPVALEDLTTEEQGLETMLP